MNSGVILRYQRRHFMQSRDYGYYLKNGGLFFHSPHSGKHTQIKDINLDSLKILSNHYCCDNVNIYHEEKLLKSNYTSYFDYESYGYFRIDNELYWYGKLIDSDFDRDLVCISHHFFTDNSSLYVNGVKYSFDADSFLVLNSFFAKDKNDVFCSAKIVNEADPETFEIVNEYSGLTEETKNRFNLHEDTHHSAFAYDKNNIYFLEKLLIRNHQSYPNIKIIKEPIIVTEKHVYYLDKIVLEADPLTFQPIFRLDVENEPNEIIKKIKLFSDYYKDKNNFYKFVEHRSNENLDKIKKLTNKDKKEINKLIKDKNRFNISLSDIETLKSILTK